MTDRHWPEMPDFDRVVREAESRGPAVDADSDQASSDASSASTAFSAARGPRWPRIEPALIGLPGTFVRMVEPHTEADPVALLAQFLVMFGNVIGRNAHFTVEADRHHGNLFIGLVGDTAKGRKGTSFGQTVARFDRHDEWRERCFVKGLSSGEGLIWAVRDPIASKVPIKEKSRVVDYEEVTTDHGVDDKRLLVVEAEFASTLKVLSRDGNTLSPTLRAAWETGTLRIMTKNSPAIATGAHVSVIGHITRPELQRHLNATEMANGFANRFIWIRVRRSKLLPDGGNLASVSFEALDAELAEAVAFSSIEREIGMDANARALWHEVYADLSRGRPGLLGSILSRAEAQVRRLAMLYALLDRSVVVQQRHLEAALALWRYSEASCRYIFGEKLGDPEADRILDGLARAENGMTRTEIGELLGKRRTDRWAAALDRLHEAGMVEVRKMETGGRPSERWLLAEAGCAISGESGESPSGSELSPLLPLSPQSDATPEAGEDGWDPIS